jgi:putative membrane protein
VGPWFSERIKSIVFKAVKPHKILIIKYGADMLNIVILVALKELKSATDMTDEKTVQAAESAVKKPDPTDMAVERTIMAADRSMMAWVRTGLSLISFGFTIYKFLEYQKDQLREMGKVVPGISGPRVFGLLMIGIGILSLLMGTVEYISTTRTYRIRYGIKRPRYSLFISGIITTIGIVLFLGILLRINGIV